MAIGIMIFDNLSKRGAASSLKRLEIKRNFKFVHDDTRNRNGHSQREKDSNYDAVFRLAREVAMTTLIINLYKNFQINAMGTLHILDAVRRYSPNIV